MNKAEYLLRKFLNRHGIAILTFGGCLAFFGFSYLLLSVDCSVGHDCSPFVNPDLANAVLPLPSRK